MGRKIGLCKCGEALAKHKKPGGGSYSLEYGACSVEECSCEKFEELNK